MRTAHGGLPASFYRQDGVDVGSGDRFSAAAGRVCSESFNNSPYVKVTDLSKGFFRGPRVFEFVNLMIGCLLDMTSDGNGTKVVLTAAARRFCESACDLLAMCLMDMTRYGGLGLVFNNVLDVRHLGEPGSETHQAFIQMVNGLGEVAKRLGIVLWRGETAELPCCITSENQASKVQFNWAGTMLGVCHPKLMITGENLAEGMIIVALKELGFRANGISSVRAALRRRFGRKWWEIWKYNWWDCPEAQPYIYAAAAPSVLYDRLLQTLNGWHSGDFEPLIKVHSIVHLSGGAWKGKLGDDVLFKRGLSADLFDLYEPPEIMQLCAGWRGMDGRGAYETWHGGQGAIAIVSPVDLDDFLRQAPIFGIEAKPCGVVTKRDDPIVRIQSKFLGGGEIVYSAS